MASADARGTRHQGVTFDHDGTDVEDSEVAPVDRDQQRARVVQALRYLETGRPGKRYTALVALWRAVSGGEPMFDYCENEAIRHYKAIAPRLRATVRKALGVAGVLEPSCRGAQQFIDLQERLEGFERRPVPRRRS